MLDGLRFRAAIKATWTAASASNTGTPSAAKMAAAVDFPMAIEPVSPTTITS